MFHLRASCVPLGLLLALLLLLLPPLGSGGAPQDFHIHCYTPAPWLQVGLPPAPYTVQSGDVLTYAIQSSEPDPPVFVGLEVCLAVCLASSGVRGGCVDALGGLDRGFQEGLQSGCQRLGGSFRRVHPVAGSLVADSIGWQGWQ